MAQIRAISMPTRVAAAAALLLSTAALAPMSAAHAEAAKAAGPAAVSEEVGSATATLTVELDDGTAIGADDVAMRGDLGEAVAAPAPADTLDAETATGYQQGGNSDNTSYAVLWNGGTAALINAAVRGQ